MVLDRSATGSLGGYFFKQGAEFSIPKSHQGTLALESGLSLIADCVDLRTDPIIVRSGDLHDFDLYPDRLWVSVATPQHIGQLVRVLIKGDGVDPVAKGRCVAVVGENRLCRRDDGGWIGVGNCD